MKLRPEYFEMLNLIECPTQRFEFIREHRHEYVIPPAKLSLGEQIALEATKQAELAASIERSIDDIKKQTASVGQSELTAMNIAIEFQKSINETE